MSGTGSVTGRVVDAAGAPVAGASVAVDAGPGPVNDIAALTGPDGRFRLGNLEPGRYGLAAVGAGNDAGRADIDVGPDAPSEVEIRVGGPGVAPNPGGLGGIVARPVVAAGILPAPLDGPGIGGEPAGPGKGAGAVAGVPVVTDRLDWNDVRLVRVSVRPVGAGPDTPPAEFLFSRNGSASTVWPAPAGARYEYTATYFLDGGLQRSVGPVQGDGPLVLDVGQGVPPA